MLYKVLDKDDLRFELPFSEFRVCGLPEVENLLENEPNKWNVVSIWSEYYDVELRNKIWVNGNLNTSQPVLKGAKSIESHYFHDANYQSDDEVVLCDEQNIKSILSYARSHRGEPLVVHCYGGISRSTALAFLILLDNIKDVAEEPIEDALAIVHHIRPQLMPNKHIINIGLPLVAGDRDTEIKWFRELFNSNIAKKISGG